MYIIRLKINQCLNGVVVTCT